LTTATETGAKLILVGNIVGFSTGQTVTIGSGSNIETATIASIAAARRRFGNANNSPTDTITVVTPLKFAHAAGTQVSGSGITLAAPLTKSHDNGTPVGSHLPTPGEPNRYPRKL
jgi:non-reducing end alpha-L-arabinofuranosidase